ncbi:hypothetical protein [Streptomyces sp. NPDC020996]|uniref:hypothetical protein n=1 Tax=Streptomyces sp. NPDC020996 TaxID=3154791 RepID=UPI003404EA41
MLRTATDRRCGTQPRGRVRRLKSGARYGCGTVIAATRDLNPVAQRIAAAALK